MARTFVMGDNLVIVDEEDYSKIQNHSWHIKRSNSGKLYLKTRIKGKATYIHQLILNSRELIDHIDGNPLNNCKSNLRFANKSTNGMNIEIRSNNTSGIKGVSWRKDKNKWEAYITKEGKRIRLGYFLNIRDAAEKRINAEIEYFGEFANQKEIERVCKQFNIEIYA